MFYLKEGSRHIMSTLVSAIPRTFLVYAAFFFILSFPDVLLLSGSNNIELQRQGKTVGLQYPLVLYLLAKQKLGTDFPSDVRGTWRR